MMPLSDACSSGPAQAEAEDSREAVLCRVAQQQQQRVGGVH